MDTASSRDPNPVYDRKCLLSDEKRNQILELWEIQKYGVDSFSDPEYLCIYGLQPSQWYARGVRLLARTAVECTRDRLAASIARDVAQVARTSPLVAGSVVIDPFAGSGNTLYWIHRALPETRAIGFESDNAVFALSSKNLSVVGAHIDLAHTDYELGLRGLAIPKDQLIVVYVAPPWGDALVEDAGLDLRRTRPPISEIVELVENTHKGHRKVYATQVYESVEPESLAELRERFDWSALRVYDLNAAGQNHGILLGTTGWTV